MALIAGRGALPLAVAQARGEVLVCALDHCPPERLAVDRTFRIETLGSLLCWLKGRGVTEVCLCGSITRPALDWRRIDLCTWPLVPRVLRALRRGDDGALRIVIDIFEGAGFSVLAAHEAAPGLLPAAGIWGRLPEGAEAVAVIGDEVSSAQGRADLGQACVLRGETVLAREDDSGTDAMLARLQGAAGGVLYKAPKPGQDRRADLPVIGPDTVAGAAGAGLRGIVIEAGGVMVLEAERVRKRLTAERMFLWVRERGAS
nr:UDP-2,3-diacylglucosamine diphosphatase LpxI [Sagittula salina]